MIPILFPYDAVDFSSHGIGDLMDTISCTTELNEDGEYELELEYPADGKYIHELMIDNLIYAKADDHGSYQAFRIYSIEKAINSLVTIHAQHISYDLSCYPVKAYEAKTCHTAVTYLIPYAISQETIPFSITTDVTEEAQNEDRKFKLEEPKSVRAALLDGDDSIKGTFGGDLVFDNFSVSLKKVGGADRGVLVEYGIDLIDMDQEENISEMITGVYPYWKGRDLTRDEDGNYIEHTDKDGNTVDKIIYGSVQYAAGSFKRHRVIPLNITEYCVNLFDAEGNDREPTVSEINQIARDWIEANEIGEPEISLTVSYADLKKDVRMHDAITVRFVKLGIDVKAKVVSYKYDTLKERCIQVTVGKAKPSILFDLEDASRLKRGLIPPKRIQNRSITSEKIETRAITPDVIDNNAIQAQHIEPEAVQSLQLDTAVQEQLGYAELFHAATLKPADIDVEALPDYFSSKELRVVDTDGNLLTEMSSDGLSSFNFNILDGDGNSAISMQNSGSIHAKNIYASVIVESPKYSLPVDEGAAEQTVNQHTHALTPDDDGKVHIGAPDFTGADHFFNIADTKFYKDKMSAEIPENTREISITAYPLQYYGTKDYNSAKMLAHFYFNGYEKSYLCDVNVQEIYEAGKTDVAYDIPENTREISITSYPLQYYGTKDYNSAKMLAHFYVDGNEKAYPYDVNVSAIYKAGKDSVVYDIPENTREISIASYPLQYYGTKDYNSAKMLAHFYVDGNEKVYPYDVNVSAIYKAGQDSVPAANYTISTNSQTGSITQYPYKEGGINNNSKALISIAFDIDGHSKTVSDDINVTGIYNVGYDTGLGSAKIDTNYSTVTINDSHFTQYDHHYIKVTVGGRATGTYSDNTTFYSTAGNILNEYKISADDVYEAGKAAGGGPSGGIQYGYCTTNVETMYNEWTNIAEGKIITFMVWDANNNLVDSKVEYVYYP